MTPHRLRATLGLAVGAAALLFGARRAARDLRAPQPAPAAARPAADADPSARVDAWGRALEGAAAAVDGRRGVALEAVRRAAEHPGLAAWAKAEASRRVGPAEQAKLPGLLEALAKDRGWRSAVLADASGRLAAGWPKGFGDGFGADASVGAKDASFAALADPSTGPGIVRHFYETPPAGGATQLVAACGVAGPDGSFAGLLKVRLDAASVLVGRNLPTWPAARPGASVYLVGGDGRPLAADAAGAAPWTDGDAAALGAAFAANPSGWRADGSGAVRRLEVWRRVGLDDGSPAEVRLFLVAAEPWPAPSAVPAAPPAAPDLSASLRGDPLGWGSLLAGLILVLGAGSLLAASGKPSAPAAPAPPAAPKAPASAPAPAPKTAPARPAVRPQEPAARPAGPDPEAQAREAALAARLRDAEETLERERAATAASRSEAEARHAEVEDLKKKLALAEDERRSLTARSRDQLRQVEERAKALEKGELTRREQEAVRLSAVNTLSTELKATLEVIKGYINALLGSRGAINDGDQEFLGVVINKSARLERLIADLVEVGEISAGTRPLRLQPLPASTLLQDVLVNVRPQAEAKNISLDLTEGPNVGQVSADREKLAAVLRTLLTQAVKVSPRSERVALNLVEREGSVELRVTDAGMALAPERASKVFVQFHGVDSPAGPEFIGAGLRFLITKAVVEAHGGKIWIESSGTKGKTFVLSLPQAAAPSLPSPGVPGALPPLPPPGAAAPGLPPLPAPSGLGPLPPPGAAPAPVPTPAPAPAPGPAPLPPFVPAPAAERPVPPVVHKPAPVDSTFNAPWKRKDVSAEEELGEMMNLALNAPAPVAPPPARPAAPPAAEPSASDLKKFSEVFGAVEGPTPPARTPSTVPAPSGLTPDFDALFAPPSQPAPPAPPRELKSLEDLDEMLGP